MEWLCFFFMARGGSCDMKRSGLQLRRGEGPEALDQGKALSACLSKAAEEEEEEEEGREDEDKEGEKEISK